jgi:hypothetical protein
MTEIDKQESERICQGDIFKDVEFFERAVEQEGIIEISIINFPLVVVLTQDCDLEGDYVRRHAENQKDQNKCLLSVIVAPLYNFEHFTLGEHLSEINLTMMTFQKDKTPYKNIKDNQNPRYHYLEFPRGSGISVIPITVIDFKHYFTVTITYLESIRLTNFVCKIKPLYREDISQRFASFLSRIGLPPKS